MSTPGVRVDHDESASFVRRLREQADALEKSAPRYTAAVIAAARADASQGSRDGEPIPLYAEAVTALTGCMQKIEGQCKRIAAKLRADADALEAASNEIAGTDDDGAAQMKSTDIGLGPVGDIGGPTAYKPNDVHSGTVGDLGGQPTHKGGQQVAFVDTAAAIAAVRGSR